VITDARGVPLVVRTGPANHRDDRMALPMLKSIPPIRQPRGRPRRKPKVFQGDRAYGVAVIVLAVVAMRIVPLLAPHGKRTAHGSGLGRTRYVVERTMSWFGNFRRLKLCFERWGRHFQALHDLAACIICAHRLRPRF
jgi:transposase